MIRILSLLFTIAFLSCNSNTKPTAETTGTTDSTETAETAETEVQFKSLSTSVPYAGSWVSKDYLDIIHKDQSPRKAQETSEEVFITLPANTLKPATMVYNFHEAMDNLVLVNRKGTFELWEKQNDSLVNAKYTIEKLADDTLKIGGKTFVKINPDLSGDQPRILEAILFAGKYTNKKGEPVEFKPNGEVTGLGKYNFYLPVIDYFDAGLQVDQIGLGVTRDKMDYFSFKFQKEKFDIYTLKCKEVDPVDKRCVDVTFGIKVYELKKTASN